MESPSATPEASDADLRSALQASEIRYRRLFESAQDGIFILNAETAQIDDANPFLVAMLGYTHAELLGKKLWEVGLFTDTTDSKAMFLELQNKGYVRYEDLPLRTRDGRQVAVEFVSNAYESNGIRVIQCNVRDITERHAATAKALRAEAIMRTSEFRYRRLFESAQDGIFILNAETAQIDDANPFLVAMLGYTHDEFLGKKLWEVGMFSDTTDSKAMFLELQTKGYVRYEDLPLRTRDGRQIAVEFVSNAYDCDGVRVIQCNVRDITERRIAAAAIQATLLQVRATLVSAVGLATVLGELRDPYTVGHERRVAHLARAIGEEFGLDKDQLMGLWGAGSLHDVGKMTVPMEILSRPGRVTAPETALIHEHPRAGFDVLRGVAWPWPVAEVALQHHERIDGNGYPQGLKGEAILLEARITAVADTVEAMSSHRPYREALGLEAALAEITRGKGTAYDESVVDACLHLFRDKHYVLQA
jgi:PAS domain S-box-containing protein